MIENWLQCIISLASKHPKQRFSLLIILAIVYGLGWLKDMLGSGLNRLCSRSVYNKLTAVCVCIMMMFSIISGYVQRKRRWLGHNRQ